MKSDAANFGLSHDAWGRLVLIDSGGQRHVDVQPVRGFPLSAPSHWISICDPRGGELVCIGSLSDLPEATRAVLETDLAKREFVPLIKRILGVSTEAEPSEWHVETDRGTTRFLLNTHDDIRRLGTFSALIVDAFGTRYHVQDTRQLDHASRQILERYL